MKEISILLTLICIFNLTLFGQQEPISTMFWNTYSYYNPANSGVDYKQFYSVQARDDNANFENNPFTVWAIGERKLESINSGVGLSYMYDEIGTFTWNKFNLNYNYQAAIGENQVLSFGMSLGIHQLTIDGTKFIYYDPIDPYIPDEKVNSTTANFRFGAIYKCNKFKLGLSVLNAEQAQYHFPGVVSFQVYRHYYLFSSYKFNVTDGFELNPNIFYQNGGNNVEKLNERGIYQLNMNGIAKEKYILGFSYRHDQVYSLNLGVNFKQKLNVMYSYDWGETALNHAVKYESHELSISYFIN